MKKLKFFSSKKGGYKEIMRSKANISSEKSQIWNSLLYSIQSSIEKFYEKQKAISPFQYSKLTKVPEFSDNINERLSKIDSKPQNIYYSHYFPDVKLPLQIKKTVIHEPSLYEKASLELKTITLSGKQDNLANFSIKFNEVDYESSKNISQPKTNETFQQKQSLIKTGNKPKSPIKTENNMKETTGNLSKSDKKQEYQEKKKSLEKNSEKKNKNSSLSFKSQKSKERNTIQVFENVHHHSDKSALKKTMTKSENYTAVRSLENPKRLSSKKNMEIEGMSSFNLLKQLQVKAGEEYTETGSPVKKLNFLVPFTRDNTLDEDQPIPPENLGSMLQEARQDYEAQEKTHLSSRNSQNFKDKADFEENFPLTVSESLNESDPESAYAKSTNKIEVFDQEKPSKEEKTEVEPKEIAKNEENPSNYNVNPKIIQQRDSQFSRLFSFENQGQVQALSFHNSVMQERLVETPKIIEEFSPKTFEQDEVLFEESQGKETRLDSLKKRSKNWF